jgi:hypothetical protein
MKKYRILFFALAALAFWAAGCINPAGGGDVVPVCPDQNTYSINGRISISDLLGDVSATVIQLKRNGIDAVSAADGEYIIPYLAAGTCNPEVSLTGYTAACYRQTKL